MTVATRKTLNRVRWIGGAACFAIVLWIWIHPRVYSPVDIRMILFMIAGFPAGIAALALHMDKDIEV